MTLQPGRLIPIFRRSVLAPSSGRVQYTFYLQCIVAFAYIEKAQDEIMYSAQFYIIADFE
jgi:hypothetical protein